jgi:NDP-sugar pyrophosphorylase family protein
VNIVIPLAGAGSRFLDAGYDKPKPLIEFGGKTMIQWAADTLGVRELTPDVLGVCSDYIEQYAAGRCSSYFRRGII